MSPLSMLISYHEQVNCSRNFHFPVCKKKYCLISRILRYSFCRYPWDNMKLSNYIISYFWNVCAALGVALPTVCVDTLFCSLSHNLCALFQIARHKMMHFEGRNTKETHENLKHVFQLYALCLNLGHFLNEYFRPLIFAQFVAASLHLCVLCYQLSANILQPALLFYAAFTAAVVGQVSIYCFCGSSIHSECQLFGQAIYESSWPHLLQENLQLVSSLKIAMMRSSLGCPIDGYFFEANRETLITVSKAFIKVSKKTPQVND